MELLDETVGPEHAREDKREARAFAAEHIEPNAAEYHDSGEYRDLERRTCADVLLGHDTAMLERFEDGW